MINDPLFVNYIAFWTFIIGLCVGSFLNVIALRGLTGESIVLPPSKCPKCHNKLKWWMNIPLVSYLLLRGKCHYCKTRISVQYPIVELVTGLFFLFIFLTFGYSISTIFYMIAISLLIVMSICDIKESVIFDLHAYLLIASGLILNAFYGLPSFIYSLSGAIFGFAIYELAAWSLYFYIKERSFGEGDSLIAAGIGAFFGWKFLLLSAFLSTCIMALPTFPYLFIRSYKTGKIKTCIALILALFLILGAYLINKFELIKSFIPTVIYALMIIILTLVVILMILSDMKKQGENEEMSFCMLPFGPAMAVSFVIIMFFGMQIKTFLSPILHEQLMLLRMMFV